MYISAVIPAYNEERTVGDVVATIKKVKSIHEIIVVSDGSRDRTALVARKLGVKVVEHRKNKGKGAAIKSGLDVCSGDIVLFLDADLIGLRPLHVESLLEPVINSTADMTIGIFSSGRLTTHLAQVISPQLSGQRAVKKEVLDSISNLEETGYGLEITLTRYAEKENLRVLEVELQDLTHIMKEEKLGVLRGFHERIKMYWQIIKGFKFARR